MTKIETAAEAITIVNVTIDGLEQIDQLHRQLQSQATLDCLSERSNLPVRDNTGVVPSNLRPVDEKRRD